MFNIPIDSGYEIESLPSRSMSYSCAMANMSSPSLASTVLIRLPSESLKSTFMLRIESESESKKQKVSQIEGKVRG